MNFQPMGIPAHLQGRAIGLPGSAMNAWRQSLGIRSVAECAAIAEQFSAREALRKQKPGPAAFSVAGFGVRYNVRSGCRLAVGYGDAEHFDVIEPGAFQNTNHRVDLFVGHTDDQTRALANTQDASLRIHDGSHGLGFTADLSQSKESRQLRQDFKLGLVTGCSLSYSATACDWNAEGSVRFVTKAKLHHIAVMVSPEQPAFPKTLIVLAD